METEPTALSNPPRQKRSRVLLSCAPCRFSKLKCDRGTPCLQCTKKAREDLCQYAPKQEKKRAPKSMAARLKRLEGMVRGMMDEDGNVISQPDGLVERGDAGGSQNGAIKGQVVRGKGEATSYVGATHCMAMLEDIEDLKCYFDDPDSDEEDVVNDEMDGPGLLLFSRGAPLNRADLLAQLPERAIADRLITRYFSSMSPSQHIMHRPTFARTYAQFHQDPSSVTLHWVAQLFMMLALGVHFNSFQAPHEIEGDSPVPASDRIKHYRSCAGWALVWGKYTQPNPTTLPAFMLYVESHFLFNRAAQMNCYILSGVLVRLMLKMGLHRDPSKLAGLSAFEGEMRRRMWNMGIQIETIVSFHMGLPSMMQSIETDTSVPRNLKDEDFDTDTLELPPSRPPTDYTTMTYPVSKTKIVRVFGQIARQAHGLTPPPYSEVLRLDTLLQETWKNVPNFMMVRPLDECVGDPPTLLIQRFGLRSLYNKSRCVLHRRYLAEFPPNKEHDYSRQQCLEGAVSLMRTQGLIWEACQPARSLAHHGWFISSLSVHDYLLAAMVLYLIIQNEHYGDASSGIEWTTGQTPTPTKDELKEMIKRSHQIWLRVSQTTAEVRKTADTLAVMLAKLGLPVDENSVSTMDGSPATQTVGSESGPFGGSGSSIMPHSSISNFQSTDPLSTMSFDGTPALALPGVSETDVNQGPLHGTDQIPFTLSNGREELNTMSFPGIPEQQPQPNHPDELPSAFDFHPSWFPASDSDMDWRYLDISLAHSHTAGANANGDDPVFTDRSHVDRGVDLGMGDSNLWM